MHFKPINLRVNYGRLAGSLSSRVVDTQNPVLSWGALHSMNGRSQSACRIIVWDDDGMLWDTGWNEQSKQEILYEGTPYQAGSIVHWSVQLKDDQGGLSEMASETFCVGALGQWQPIWIAAAKDVPGQAVYFNKTFTLEKEIKSATLFVCGIGYQKVWINASEADHALLQPAVSDYSIGCYYVTIPSMSSLLKRGENTLAVELGNGWRRSESDIPKHFAPRTLPFEGIPQLAARLLVHYADGTSTHIDSDTSWYSGQGAITSNDLFQGETFDARNHDLLWNSPQVPANFTPAVAVEAPCKSLRAQVLEPILEQKEYKAVTISSPRGDVRIFDFGQNIAGVCRVRIPGGIRKGQTITLRHAEILDEEGMLYTAPLRSAKATDVYIASGDDRDLVLWQPQFTYHGFRYAEVSGWPGIPEADDITAIAFYTDIDKDSYFRCGSPIANELHRMVVQTERANLHGIATDCPQRDERMGWMNDATVRFEEISYNFETGRLFPKIIADIIDTQSEDGAITCTAPYVFGSRPADPVCSSFLVAGAQALLHTGNRKLIEEAYGAFRKWNECLISHSSGHIVDFSYYGDWAGPQDACIDDSPCSAVTPGLLMSTGYCYYNACQLSRFAVLLGDTREAAAQQAIAEDIRLAFHAKWWDESTATVATGSQACQAFALWLGILPESSRPKAAKLMNDDVESRGFRITTGNLCTRYLLDMLCEYGYADTAWKLITREEYPSWGYMMQNGATTVWERFELKKDPGMNSHCHPMFGAVGFWFYRYIAGIEPVGPNWEKIRIKPHMPQSLSHAEASVDTPRGPVAAKWFRQYGKTFLHVTVPFGATAEVCLPGGVHLVESGFWRFQWE